jgi:hypothetical protein
MTDSNTHTWNYSEEEFAIPGPIIQLDILNSDNKGQKSSADFILDSGSDITWIKKEIFDILELIIDGEDTLLLPGGKKVTCPKCSITLEIPELNISEDLSVVIDEENADNLLGRDFLNKFGIYLDGPKLEFSIIA